LINQAIVTLTEFCQGPCHENQNCIASNEAEGLDIIIALTLLDIKPLQEKAEDYVLLLKVSSKVQTFTQTHVDYLEIT
jgi:hypothetical protein